MKISFKASVKKTARFASDEEVANAPATFSPFDKAFDEYVTKLYKERPIYASPGYEEPRKPCRKKSS